MLYTKSDLKKILNFWNISFAKIRTEFVISGSPERNDFRIVVEDNSASLYLLENFSEKSRLTKKRIIDILNFLDSQGLKKINKYLKNKNDKYILEYDAKFWQIQKFIIANNLDRNNYIYDEWRGKVLAKWLINFQEKSKNIKLQNISGIEIFSLKKYVSQIYKDVQANNPEIISQLKPIINFLESDLMDNYENLTLSFCHGDYHPLNVIWSERDIKAVIDWEFCGYKPEIYDIANMISCVGMEDPECLDKGLVKSFIKELRLSHIISEFSWKYLVDFMIAIRFAWLAEWLRKKDLAMIDLELTYMHLLKNNYHDLNKIFNTSS